MTTLLRFDGACKGNPGPSSSAFVLFAPSNGSSVLAEGLTKHPTSLTNNQAEYLGLIGGLRKAHSLGISNLRVEGDSQLVIEQVFGSYKVRSANLTGHYTTAMQLKQGFQSITGHWIPREQNYHADKLCNDAFHAQGSPASEFELHKAPSVLAQMGLPDLPTTTAQRPYALPTSYRGRGRGRGGRGRGRGRGRS